MGDEPAHIVVYTGPMRVHFNRHGAAPRVWSITPIADTPDAAPWELCVSAVECSVITRSAYRAKQTPDDEDGLPSAWFEVLGVLLLFADGLASIQPLPVAE